MTYLFICLIIWIICGFLSSDLQCKKGYDNGFWIGFLLGVLGLIYSAGLPDINKKKIKKQTETESLIENDYNEENNNNFILCKNCGFPIYDDEKKCSNCGKIK